MLTHRGKSLLGLLRKQKEEEERQRRIKQQQEDMQWAENRINTIQSGPNPWGITLAEGHSFDLATRRLRAVLSLLGISETEAGKIWPGLVTPTQIDRSRCEFTLSKSDFIALLENSEKARGGS